MQVQLFQRLHLLEEDKVELLDLVVLVDQVVEVDLLQIVHLNVEELVILLL